MNSAIHLCQSPLPVAPGLHSSPSRVHVSLSHASLSVSLSSKRSHLVSSPSLHMESRLPGFSDWSKMNEEIGKKNNIVRGRERGASPAMSWVPGAFSLSAKMNRRPILACAGQCSDPAEDSEMGPWEKLVTSQHFKEVPSPKAIEALKAYAMVRSKDDAKTILDKVSRLWKGSGVEDELLTAYAELLVYQEDYEQANLKLDELRETVKADEDYEEASGGTSAFMGSKWKKYYLLKAIVASVNQAKEEAKDDDKAKQGGKDDDKAKQLWRHYLTKINSKKPGDDSGSVFSVKIE